MRARLCTAFVAAAMLALMPLAVSAEAIPVELRQTDDGWQLLRGGQPYLIRGAGGTHSLQQLADAGANSIRTWDADGIDALLDEAASLELSVAVGIWLGHERHGFDYTDKMQVAAQFERARQIVLRYKDHPAVLLWGVGNEMEGYESGDDPAIWTAVNDIAAMIKQLDPNHPTMSVTADIGGGRIQSVHKNCPAIDIHGINSYGGAPSLPERLRAGGASKPYIITEFGPVGPWEMPRTEWGAPFEQTSTEKSAFYRKSYEDGVIAAAGFALGSYAFNWGYKMEGTSTWFGMFLSDGSRLGAVDTMTELWSGARPADLAPTIEPLAIDGGGQLEPGERVRVQASVRDPEDRLKSVRWVLRAESGEYATGGDFRPDLPDIEGVLLEGDASGASLRMPDDPGPYRLFLYAYDAAGNAATANVPLLVKGEAGTRLPVSVYENSFDNMPWVPSGWMGATDFLVLDGDQTEIVHEGTAAVEMRYSGKFGWVGVAWQDPPNNWGDLDGGYDLTGASYLEVWAKGEYGGEEISLGVGLLGPDTANPDSGTTKLEGIVLKREWQRYRIPLDKIDLSSIKTGLVVTLKGRSAPVTVYLDSIRYVR
jgi:hypothetical protein